MKVHLIKDGEVGTETFTEVIDILQAISGPIEFTYDSHNVINFEEDELLEKRVSNVKAFEKSHSIPLNYSTKSMNIIESKETRPLKKFEFPFSRKNRLLKKPERQQ